MRRTARALMETALAVSPWAPAPKPHSAAAVTADWLTGVFAAKTPGAVVEKVRSLDGTTGTTDRRRLGLEWNRVGADAGLPTAVFIKSTPLSAKNRTMVAALDMAINEVAFYQQIRPELPADAAPAVYAAHAGHGARHLLVLEDLASRGARFPDTIRDVDLAHVQAVIRALGQLHATFWNSPRLRTDLSWVAPESQRPGFDLLLWQFRKMRKTLLAAPEHDLPPSVRRMAEFANENDRALHARWEIGPQTVLHGDAHCANTFGLPDGRGGLLDWQVIHSGPGLREVSYLLTHSTPTEVRRGNEESLLRLYLETLREYGVAEPPSFDEAWTALRFFVFDAWDSIAMPVVWPGLQPEERVNLGFATANATVEDLEVDKVIRAALG
ncbi:hypothetical protein [Nocardia higoensis]|uniref:hypothetical protein n=1 Tax=Nocardia higoensis TaxID=228599 RepID=UPI0003140E58|nr:hypothetical protein [Nocardia higoensis]